MMAHDNQFDDQLAQVIRPHNDIDTVQLPPIYITPAWPLSASLARTTGSQVAITGSWSAIKPNDLRDQRTKRPAGIICNGRLAFARDVKGRPTVKCKLARSPLASQPAS